MARYWKIVRQYREGADSAIATIAAWPGAELARVSREMWRPKKAERLPPGWDEADVWAACLLHLEVLMRNPGQPQLRASHMQVLREHLSRLRRSSGLSSITAELHVALAVYLQGQLQVEDLQGFFEEVGRDAASSGEFLLAKASFGEMLASPRLQPARRAKLVGSAGRSLEEAERLFREALAVSPGLREAEVRLGHVVLLRNRPDEAIALLEAALDHLTDGDQRYFASLFLGQAYRTAGRTEASRRVYAAAAAEVPCGQAASMALAQGAFQDGRFDEARAALGPALKPSSGCIDPWASYDLGQIRKLDGLTATIRAALWR